MEHQCEPASREGEVPRWATALAVGVYLTVALVVSWQLRFRLSPDGLAYLQVAQHYANGSFDLAVNSWWGPMLSWLMVPFIWLHVPPILTVRLLNAGCGLGFAFAVRSLASRFTNQRGRFIAFLLGLIIGLILLPRYLTPGVLLTFLVTWYLVLTAGLLEDDSPSMAFKVGLFGGVTYLTKAYSLPFVAAHLLLTVFIKMMRRGRPAIAPCLRQYVAGIGGLLLVSSPWILAISAQDGGMTISSVGKHASAWSAYRDGNWDEKTMRRLQQPRDGRISTWENPMEIPFAWPLWSPFDGKEAMRKQVQRIRENLSLLPTRMSADEKGLMALGLLFALVQLFPLPETLKTSRGNLRLWGCLTVLLYLGGYIPILVFDRYLSPISGMLIVLCVSGPEPGWLNTLLSKRSVAEQLLAKFHSLLSIGHGVFLAVLAGALLFSLRGRLWMELRQNGWVDQAAVFKQVGEALKGRTVLAANDWNRGLHVAYWAKSQFIGAVEGKQPERIARELVSFGRPVLLVFGDKELMGALAASPLFAPVALNGRNFLWVFEIRKDADDQNLPTKPN